MLENLNPSFVIGIDEVGRGCIAGPVTVAGIKLDSTYPLFTNYFKPFTYKIDNDLLYKVRDSKKINVSLREKIHQSILDLKLPKLCLSASAKLIDEYGIGVCIGHLMSLIALNLSVDENKYLIILDGKINLPKIFNSTLLNSIVKENGLLEKSICDLIENNLYNNSKILIKRENYSDDTYLSVALASNYAKVARDREMSIFDEQNGNFFDWQKNKGYATSYHRKKILEQPDHVLLRKTFLTKILQNNL
jgi:ribonuclease HII